MRVINISAAPAPSCFHRHRHRACPQFSSPRIRDIESSHSHTLRIELSFRKRQIRNFLWMLRMTSQVPTKQIIDRNFVLLFPPQGTFTLVVEAWHAANESKSRSPGKYFPGAVDQNMATTNLLRITGCTRATITRGRDESAVFPSFRLFNRPHCTHVLFI